MATSNKATHKKLAPAVRETIVKVWCGNVQPLVVLTRKAKAPTTGWRGQLPSPEAIASLLESI